MNELLTAIETEATAFQEAAAGAVVALESGSFQEALGGLDRLAAERPDAAWLYVLRSRAHKGLQDFASAQRDLDRALKLGPSVWLYLERSRLFEELGSIGLALEDVESALALQAPTPGLYLRRAHLQICRRHYHLAIADYSEALALDPQDASTYLSRARVHAIRGDLDLAVPDARQAEALSGGALKLERVHMEILSGGSDALAAELAGMPGAEFERGCLEFKRRRFGAAAAQFDRAFGGPDSRQDSRARFFGTLARTLDGTWDRGMRPKPTDKARLHICGLGFKPPFTVTADVLRAVLDCDFIFNNLSEPEVADLLHLLAPSCRPTMFDIQGGGPESTKTIFQEIRAGRTVGFVTRGHPLVCGGLASNLIRECIPRGVEYRVFNAVSSMDTLAMDLWEPGRGSFAGSQVLDSTLVTEPLVLDTRLPLVVYFNASIFELPRAAYDDFCSVLETRYGAGHPCRFYGRRFDVEPGNITVGDIRSHFGRIDAAFTLVLGPA